MEQDKLYNKISTFIKEHHVLTLATSADNKPWCCQCFYVFLEDEALLVFTSSNETKHVQDVEKQAEVAVSIVLETSVVGKVQGVQITGRMFEPKDDLSKKVNKAYMRRFPFAKLMNTNLWVVEVDYMKMTDNRLGFGKKHIWERSDEFTS